MILKFLLKFYLNSKYSIFQKFPVLFLKLFHYICSTNQNITIMKRVILALVAMVFSAGIASAQNYMVVDSEKVFKSLAETVKDTPLASVDETWQFIYDDLMFAAENLPEEWNAQNSGRVTKGAAYAMLSRAMLYAERWDDAKSPMIRPLIRWITTPSTYTGVVRTDAIQPSTRSTLCSMPQVSTTSM